MSEDRIQSMGLKSNKYLVIWISALPTENVTISRLVTSTSEFIYDRYWRFEFDDGFTWKGEAFDQFRPRDAYMSGIRHKTENDEGVVEFDIDQNGSVSIYCIRTRGEIEAPIVGISILSLLSNIAAVIESINKLRRIYDVGNPPYILNYGVSAKMVSSKCIVQDQEFKLMVGFENEYPWRFVLLSSFQSPIYRWKDNHESIDILSNIMNDMYEKLQPGGSRKKIIKFTNGID